MPITSVLRFQDYQFQVSLASGAWKWTTRVDVTGSQVSTQIREVISPFGLLRDSIPIPGEVAQAMAESIVQVVSTYAPSLLLSPTELSFVVDEGRGTTAAIPVHITNNGILGSLLTVQATSSVGYVSATPANVGGLGANASGSFNVSVNSTDLVATASPYSATLRVQCSTATNSPQDIPITVTVRPKPVIAVTATTLRFNASAPLAGRFPPIPSQIVVLSNSGLSASMLDYQIRGFSGASWLAGVSPMCGVVNGGASQPITVVVSPPDGTLPGVYSETLRISGYSSNTSLDIVVTLNIS